MPKSPSLELMHSKLLSQVQPNKICEHSVIPDSKVNLPFAYVKCKYFINIYSGFWYGLKMVQLMWSKTWFYSSSFIGVSFYTYNFQICSDHFQQSYSVPQGFSSVLTAPYRSVGVTCGTNIKATVFFFNFLVYVL